MTQTRRSFLTTAAAAGTITFLPFKGRAQGQDAHSFESDAGTFTVHPVSHASVVLETPIGVMYIDPVGEAAQYSDFPAADMILITHEHGDHYNADTLNALMGEDTMLLTNPAVFDMLPEDLRSNAMSLANGEMTEQAGVSISAIPAYNTTEGRTDFHPEGRDNGYVLDFDGFRVYVSGDTEDIPEMRALENIDLAFVCMNLPFTMDATAAASAVTEFAPSYVYPYHYRGRDGGTQDPAEFSEMLEGDIEVRMGNWYA